MADLLIKGYDLKGSEILQLMECKDGSYLTWNVYDEEQKECEVVEIPTHGRLIDESVFVDNVIKYSHQSTKSIGEALKATPTVIEASEDGEQDGKL